MPAAAERLQARFGRAGGRIGRSPSCALALPAGDLRVSREHLEIRWREGRFMLKVISRSNGVQVNETSVPPGAAVELFDGDRIALGACLLVAELQGAQGPGLALLLEGQDPWLAPLGTTDGSTPAMADAFSQLERECAPMPDPLVAPPSLSADGLQAALPLAAGLEPVWGQGVAPRPTERLLARELLQALSPDAIEAGLLQRTLRLARLLPWWHDAACWRQYRHLHDRASLEARGAAATGRSRR